MDISSRLSISDLPPYILIHIFKFINQTDLLFSVSQTCCLWQQLSQERVLWRTLNAQNFPDYTFTPKSFLELLRSTSDSIEHLHFDLLQHDLKTIKHEGTECSNLKEICMGVQSKNRLSNKTVSTIDMNNGLLRLSEKYPSLKKLCIHNQVLLFEDIFRDLEEFVYESVDRSVGRIRVKEFLNFHPGLKCLSLRKCILSVATLTKILTEYPDLEKLDLCGSICVFDEVNFSVSEENINVPKLNEFNASETDIVDGLLKKIARKANNLHHINLAKCPRVTNASIEDVAKNCQNLKTLIINEDEVSISEGQCDVTTAGIERIAENCHLLTVLKLNHCPEVENTGVAAIAKVCNRLVELEIAGCLSLQDETVLSLVRNCPKLQRLNVGGCPQLTGKALSFVLKSCKDLKYLNIQTCHRVTNLDIIGNKTVGTIEETSDIEQSENNNNRNEDNVGAESESHKDSSGKEIETNENEGMTTGKVVSNGAVFERNYNLRQETDVDVELRLPQSENSASEQSLKVALRYHSHVKIINLSFCSMISNNCIKQIAQKCADLSELDIQACYMVTNAGVRELLKQCKFLKVLNISGGSVSQTSRLTDECLADVLKYGKRINKLKIVKNYNITADAVFSVVQNCDKIQSVSVEVSKRSNINKETLIELSGRVKDKTICLQFRADVEILVFKDAEFKIRQKYHL